MNIEFDINPQSNKQRLNVNKEASVMFLPIRAEHNGVAEVA